MPLTPIPGVVRLRKFQLGKESTSFTQVAATRRMPWGFTGTVDPHWTETTADTGTLDWAVAPYQTAVDVTGTATGELFSNDTPSLWSAALMGGITPVTGSGISTWTYAPASLTQDVFDTFTGEWADDATGDGFAGTGGVIESLTLTGPQGNGPITLSANWRFASYVYPQTPTGALSVDTNPTYLMGADTNLSIDTGAGSIGISLVSDALYDWSFTLNNNLDIKRFQNGSNSRFKVRNYGRGLREITATFNFAKSTAAIAESVNFLTAGAAVERFVGLNTVSNVLISGTTYHSQRIRFGGYWTARGDTTIGSNTGFQLTCHNVYDATLTYPLQVVVANTRTTL